MKRELCLVALLAVGSFPLPMAGANPDLVVGTWMSQQRGRRPFLRPPSACGVGRVRGRSIAGRGSAGFSCHSEEPNDLFRFSTTVAIEEGAQRLVRSHFRCVFSRGPNAACTLGRPGNGSRSSDFFRATFITQDRFLKSSSTLLHPRRRLPKLLMRQDP